MGYEISIEEKIARWHKTNTPNGDPVGPVFERTIEEISKILLPSEKTPIPVATILGQMDLDFLEPVLLRYYKKKPHYSPVSIFKGIMLQKRRNYFGVACHATSMHIKRKHDNWVLLMKMGT